MYMRRHPTDADRSYKRDKHRRGLRFKIKFGPAPPPPSLGAGSPSARQVVYFYKTPQMHIRRNLAEGRGSRRMPTEATNRISGADVAIFLVKIRLAGPGRLPPFRSRKASSGISILSKIRLMHFGHRSAYAVATSNTEKLPTGKYPDKNAPRAVGGRWWWVVG